MPACIFQRQAGTNKQIVILDNFSIHLGPRAKEAIEARGCQLLFLPAYSPDFSPIEEAFSKLKTILRRVGARTREALQDAIIQALPTITAKDALGWFQSDPSWNQDFLTPTLRAFGHRKVQEALLQYLEQGTPREQAGALRAWYC